MNLDTLVLDRIACSNFAWAGESNSNAHHAMQVHRECSVGTCAAKTAAFARLKAAGRLTPDSGRARYA
ncbi:hypothetical protein [Nocardia farcinica]|uniref:hypothetical protein n=1 Tax=Nocardia farcinica TaxID=37329 RepID=UPI00189571E8|nr:hypothetical protein [Nocardia farcinica]MBF6267918.1 hypothetical protein [Nocardia farcinica]MCZ9327929.1 hypothetical protein [Nocardia farcinica]